MRITSIGHAGLFVETTGGTILCDPWFDPAFFGSWFPFPRNDHLDMSSMSNPDYLYVSHSHRDHLDVAWLARNVDRSATVLLPEFGIAQLEAELRAIGFGTFLRTRDRQPVDLDGGLRIAIISLAAPNIGPMGDSALLVADPSARIIDQNDAHPHEIGDIDGFDAFDGHFLQHSGAIWYPMVYELAPDDEATLVDAKRRHQLARAIGYVEMVGAPHVFPTAGPPCFLDDELFGLNDVPGGTPTIFPDARLFLDALAAHGHGGGHLMVPGTVAELDGGCCTTTHPVDDAGLAAIFDDKAAYLDRYRADMAPVIAAERASWPTRRTDLLAALEAWLEPLLAEAPHTRRRIGGAIGIDAGDEGFVIDVVEGTVRAWADDEPDPRFVFRIDRSLLEVAVARREPDWCNHVFLSCRFRASRDGPYNEYVYTFFKSLSAERMRYAEAWYAAREADADIDWVVVDGWELEARCPHQRASLVRMGEVCDDVLTCGLHGWRFDLHTGRCLDADGVYLRVRGRVD